MVSFFSNRQLIHIKTLSTRKNCFRYLKLMSPLNKWYYLKNNYSTLRSKVKVQWRSLRYTTHRLMVMHPHTKYHWLISKDKKVMVRTSFAKKQKKWKKGRHNTTNSCNNNFKYCFNKLYYNCKHLIFWLFQLLSSVGSSWYNQRHMSRVQ